MASLTPDTASTSTRGTTVVNQASEDIWGINCRKKRSELRNFLPFQQTSGNNKDRNAALSPICDPTKMGQHGNPRFAYKTSCNLRYKHGIVRKCGGLLFHVVCNIRIAKSAVDFSGGTDRSKPAVRDTDLSEQGLLWRSFKRFYFLFQ